MAQTWWFYLPLREESWENRKFATVDINEPELPQRLISLLSRENVISGENMQSAETLLRSRRISENLPRAWEAVRPEIVNRLIEVTEGLCHYRPDTREVEQFLSRNHNLTAPGAGVLVPQDDQSSEALESDDLTSTRPSRFTFLEESYSVNSWNRVLTEVCRIRHVRHMNQFEAEVFNLRRPRGRPYFSRTPADLGQAHEVNESGIFVETQMNANYIVKTAHMVISHFGYTRDNLQVEYSPIG